MIKKSHTVRWSFLTASVLILVFWFHAGVASQAVEQQQEAIELPAEAINKLKIEAGFGWGIFSGTIYNGNSEYLITQLTVNMTPIHDDHMEMMGHMSHEPKTHQINLNLAPLAKGALSMALEGDDTHVHDFDWEILQVLGRKIN